MNKFYKFFIMANLLAFTVSLSSHAQSKLKITDLQIAVGDSKYEKYADKVANLASDIPVDILLYRENNVSYYACFYFVERGKKLKLMVQDYVLFNDDKVKGDRQKVKQHIDGALGNERMVGLTEEEIVYNKDLGNKIRAIYRFEVLY